MNPYTAPTVVPISGAADPGRDHWSYRWHFLSFNASFTACLLVFYCVFAGPTMMLASFLSEPVSWLIQAGLGVFAWVAHAILLCCFSRLRTRGPFLVGLVGASAFIVLLFVSQIIQNYAPNSISVPWSWTPEPVRLAIFTTGSLAGVVLLAAFSARTPQNG